MKQTKYYKEYLKALREDVRALERGINDTNRIKKLTNEGYNLFKLSIPLEVNYINQISLKIYL